MMRVRFNLGRGNHYKNWQVTLQNNEKLHYDPSTCQITLYNGTLYNKRQSAEKIYHGSCKFVCSWIECVTIITNCKKESMLSVTGLEEVMYNPRKSPYWTNKKGEDLDNIKYSSLITKGNRIYIKHI